jgi:hypothetical protein
VHTRQVLSLEDEKGNVRISLSIKTVNQTTGVDQDPTNLVAAQDDKGKRGDRSLDRPRIELGAVYNTKVGGWVGVHEGVAGGMPA